jgi:hypothetical protein
MIGQNNDYVFRELLGLTDDEYRSYVEEQVIY